MLKDIVGASPLGDYRVHVVFEDGVEGEVDVSEVVPFECVFAPLG